MAPEQAHLSAAPDASWDVYAVGAIMYRLLTGQPPYRADEIVEQLDTAGSLEKRLNRYQEVINESPPPSRHLQRTDVDRMLGRIVSKCLAPNPQDRYANVQQILQDLNRRDVTRAKRPLMLLGIVGPLLVLLATCIFAARSIRQASNRTVQALRQEAFGSNELAAAFAARTLESEIERYYQLTREEASRDDFVDQLKATMQSDEVRESLAAIAAMKTPLATHGSNPARDQLMDSPAQLRLDHILNKRLALYSNADAHRRRRRLASMYVTDSLGTIISIAYEDAVSRNEKSTGRNYCYRTYFHGGRVDLPKESTEIGSVQPLTSTHMSAAFPSTATRLWKVAISTPIFLTDDREHPDAMFVVTVNLGDFELLQSKQGNNQVAVLVEARPGPTQGTILQHPLMEDRRTSGVNMAGEKYQIPNDQMERLLAGSDVDYLDPLAAADGGEPYAGHWIAAMQPVSLPIEDSPDENPPGSDPPTVESDPTDLLVLVQYRLEKVIAPVAGMRSALLWEGALAVGSILLVTLSLWLVVRRVSNRSSDRMEDPKPIAEIAETIEAR